MRISIILVILLLIMIGFLMIYNALGMQDRDAILMKIMIIILGGTSLFFGIYLFIKYTIG